ncbi:ABC transporter transmembrane domain-containing protein [Proteus vulgaris]|uniref:ABC transporter transmembrane domain-containing protein n=1 Tax=Proteus vulgaris TaxID=585 RepID=UPI000659C3FC|nr:ABC transporter transmembrane domain-containing protein [Proteus vulgaris]CRL62099.1 Alpha-hemolysin translocation ATP-binding protein HlyB [Proteus vulgaris]
MKYINNIIKMKKYNYSIIDGLIYFSKKNNGNIKSENIFHFLGKDNSLNKWNVLEAAQLLNLKCKLDILDYEDKKHHLIDTLVEINNKWYVLKEKREGFLIIFDIKRNIIIEYKIDKKQKLSTVFIINKQHTSLRNKFNINWFISTILKQKKSLLLVFILSSCSQLFALVNPLIFETLIDKVLTGRNLSNLHLLGYLLLLIAITEPVYLFLRDKLYVFISCQFSADFSGKIYQHLIRLPSSFFNQRQSGQIIARIQELSHIRQFITGSALMLVLDLIFIIIFISVMFTYSAPLTWVTLGALILYFTLWLILGPIIRYWVEQEYQANADNTSLLTETITGIETIKITATENLFIDKWQYKIADHINKRFSATKKKFISSTAYIYHS